MLIAVSGRIGGVKKRSVSPISEAAKTEESGVEAPACSFTAVLEKPPEVG